MRRLILILCVAVCAVSSNAQPNSVILKDGSGTQLSTHAGIGAAYAAIPAVLAGAYIIELTGTYTGMSEAYPINFISKTGASASNTITLRPEASVTNVSIASTQTGAALIKLTDADYIIIDGRPGGTGTTKALHFQNMGTSSTSYSIHFIDGACNNVVRYCTFSGYGTPSTGGKAVYIGTSASNPTGNSNNTFEFLTFNNGPRYYLNASGTDLNPNRNILVHGCEFININFCGWWQQGGNGKVTVDSCFFYNTAPGGSSGTGTFPILSDFQRDTIVLTRNVIYNIDNSSYNTDVMAMAFRSFREGAVTFISNNFISLMANNPSSDVVYGIAFGTNNANDPVNAAVYHNTVLIGGTLSGGTANNLNSAPLNIEESDTLAKFDVMNNIFINTRTGGNELHVAVAKNGLLGTFDMNYNTYASASTTFSQVAGITQADLAAYQSAMTPNEASSNAEPVQFVSNTDLHLTGSSVGNANLLGIPLVAVTDDIDGDLRVDYYRGADEAGTGTGIEEINDRSVMLFPNPASGSFRVHGIDEYARVEILSVTGAVHSVSNGRTKDIDVSMLASGFYMVRIIGKQTHCLPLVIR